uniref:CRAL-TRIO domain-containing protein n=1 Tax=Anopheles atroparvus TaxID=41427 RepID=A0AAG5D4X5_ANOAO
MSFRWKGRFIFILPETLLELEKVQNGGIFLLLDYTRISIGTYEDWGTMEVKITFDGIGRFYPVRYREIHAANVSKVVDSFVEYLITAAPPAFKEKIHLHSSEDKLKELMEPATTLQAYRPPYREGVSR